MKCVDQKLWVCCYCKYQRWHKKKTLFLNLAGENLVQIFDSLFSTDTLNYSNTVKLLTEHFAPCKNVQYAIFMFRKCRRRDKESLTSFYSTLRSLSVNCEFSENLDRELIVQIIIIIILYIVCCSNFKE